MPFLPHSCDLLGTHPSLARDMSQKKLHIQTRIFRVLIYQEPQTPKLSLLLVPCPIICFKGFTSHTLAISLTWVELETHLERALPCARVLPTPPLDPLASPTKAAIQLGLQNLDSAPWMYFANPEVAIRPSFPYFDYAYKLLVDVWRLKYAWTYRRLRNIYVEEHGELQTKNGSKRKRWTFICTLNTHGDLRAPQSASH